MNLSAQEQVSYKLKTLASNFTKIIINNKLIQKKESLVPTINFSLMFKVYNANLTKCSNVLYLKLQGSSTSISVF